MGKETSSFVVPLLKSALGGGPEGLHPLLPMDDVEEEGFSFAAR